MNRKWFLAAGITAVFCTAACVILLFTLEKTPENAQIIGTFFIMSEIIVLALCGEWHARNLEQNIKCRFTDYTLASGISKNMFVLSELLKNLITVVIGFTMCAAMNGVMGAFDSSFWSIDDIKFLIAATLLISVVNWILIPLVIKLKSAEKAGVVVGLVLGFGVVCPLMIMFKVLDNGADVLAALMDLVNKAWFFPAFLGACAALYAIFYAIILHRVKWGDVC